MFLSKLIHSSGATLLITLAVIFSIFGEGLMNPLEVASTSPFYKIDSTLPCCNVERPLSFTGGNVLSDLY